MLLINKTMRFLNKHIIKEQQLLDTGWILKYNHATYKRWRHLDQNLNLDIKTTKHGEDRLAYRAIG